MIDARMTAVALATSTWLIAAPARAQQSALPADLVALDTPEGEALLVEAAARADYFHLAGHHTTQETPSACGIASAVTILNALQVPAPLDDKLGVQTFTHGDFFNTCARDVFTPQSVARGGTTLAQLADLLRCHPVRVDVVHGEDTTLEDFRKRLAENLADPTSFIVVNYLRSEVGQEYTGHHSPLGAYNAAKDRVLVMDVARYKYPPTWVRTESLYNAIRTTDLVSGRSRGYLVVAAAEKPPGPSGERTARSPLRILGGIVAAVFVVGFGLGAVVGAWRTRRKLARKA
ncbi:phytochelatin synthase family protein [Polyangium sp. 6x1]|uniref:phytochelatin synthase family protein n=1 Tax=Polyangium sp. 6x1 TaxID=3042689 RepID=UPI002482CB75|nr:phytochelatin synthase family protein [Polyangium sp. 6x1]MDI1442702.1 phytochelatin synthase family protein [Polyangium sp. 6x1]